MDTYFKRLTVIRFFMLFLIFYIIAGVSGAYISENITNSVYINLVNILFYIILYILIVRVPLSKVDRKKIHYNPKEDKLKPLLLISPFFILNLSSVIYIQILNLIDSSLVDRYLDSPNLTSNLEIYEDPVKIAIFFLVIVVMAPIVEELVFRGVLFNLLNKSIKTLPAMILSSLFFGVLHSKTFIPTAIIGFLICFIYQKTGNIKYSIMAHMFNNLIAFVMPLLTGNIIPNETMLLYTGIIVIILDIFFAFYVIKYLKDNKEYFKINSPLKRMNIYTEAL
ncbi:MAG: CPBP family intramembrane metalloprotease [Clostridium sp.]|nr:CPBP family intramembrane metalloprotease [Clostridium sp.]